MTTRLTETKGRHKLYVGIYPHTNFCKSVGGLKKQCISKIIPTTEPSAISKVGVGIQFADGLRPIVYVVLRTP